MTVRRTRVIHCMAGENEATEWLEIDDAVVVDVSEMR